MALYPKPVVRIGLNEHCIEANTLEKEHRRNAVDKRRYFQVHGLPVEYEFFAFGPDLSEPKRTGGYSWMTLSFE